MTTPGYTNRCIGALAHATPPKIVPGEPHRLGTIVEPSVQPLTKTDMISWDVEAGLCNPGLHSFVYRAEGPTKGYYLGINKLLKADGCGTEYKTPASDVVLLSPAEAAASPADATWMLVDPTDLTGSFPAECGGEAGSYFAFVFLAGMLVYVVGGVAYGKKVLNKQPSVDCGHLQLATVHPHWSMWAELYALCADGAAFARSRGKVRAGGGGGRLEKPLNPGTIEGERRREGSSSGISGSTKERKSGGSGSKSQSDKGSGKKSKSSKRSSAAEPAAAPVAAVAEPAAAVAAAGTAAGGGGRWVHMPA